MRFEPTAEKTNERPENGCFRDLTDRAQLPAKSLLALTRVASHHCTEGCLVASAAPLQQHQHRHLEQSHLLHSF